MLWNLLQLSYFGQFSLVRHWLLLVLGKGSSGSKNLWQWILSGYLMSPDFPERSFQGAARLARWKFCQKRFIARTAVRGSNQIFITSLFYLYPPLPSTSSRRPSSLGTTTQLANRAGWSADVPQQTRLFTLQHPFHHPTHHETNNARAKGHAITFCSSPILTSA